MFLFLYSLILTINLTVLSPFICFYYPVFFLAISQHCCIPSFFSFLYFFFFFLLFPFLISLFCVWYFYILFSPCSWHSSSTFVVMGLGSATYFWVTDRGTHFLLYSDLWQYAYFSFQFHVRECVIMMLTRPVFLRRLNCVVVRSSRNPFNNSGRMYYEMVLLTIGFYYWFMCYCVKIWTKKKKKN